MSILRKLLGIDSNTLEVKEAIGFNPTNVELIEGNGVDYGRLCCIAPYAVVIYDKFM